MQCKSRRMRPRYAADTDRHGQGPIHPLGDRARCRFRRPRRGLGENRSRRVGTVGGPGRLSRPADTFVHKRTFRQAGHGFQGDNSCARTRFTPKPLIYMNFALVIFWPYSRKPTKSGAWNARPTPSCTHLSTAGVDSSDRDAAEASADARKRPAVKPDPGRLCTAASSPRFSGDFAVWPGSIHVFHAQAIDFKSSFHGHNFAIFTEGLVFRGVERRAHTLMHMLIHRLCG
jgi:hypothetical protein